MKQRGPLFRAFAVLVVSAWLAIAFVWLLVTGRLPAHLIWRCMKAPFRRRFRGTLGEFAPETGNCWLARVPAHVPSDGDIGSSLVVLEDGVPLPLPHAAHDDIRSQGLGRYSHWCGNVYFATSDNSDPRSNGRRYTVEER